MSISCQLEWNQVMIISNSNVLIDYERQIQVTIFFLGYLECLLQFISKLHTTQICIAIYSNNMRTSTMTDQTSWKTYFVVLNGWNHRIKKSQRQEVSAFFAQYK
jgi:hypothetical protein